MRNAHLAPFAVLEGVHDDLQALVFSLSLLWYLSLIETNADMQRHIVAAEIRRFAVQVDRESETAVDESGRLLWDLCDSSIVDPFTISVCPGSIFSCS